MIAAGIGFQHTGVNCKSLALHKTYRHRSQHPPLKNVAQYIAFADAAQPVGRKGRVMWDLIIQVQYAEMG